MDRRSFLGSVIGFVAGLPFVAISADLTPPTRWKQPYRMTLRDNLSGFVIHAPPIKEIVFLKDAYGKLYGFNFVAETLKVSEAVRVDRLALLTDDGKVIGEGGFDMIHAYPPDEINVTYQLIGRGLKFSSVEELVKLKLSRQKF